MKIKISDIKPIGNFKELLETFNIEVTEIENKINNIGMYSNDITDMIKKIINANIINTIEDSIRENDIWDKAEAKICLLYMHLLIIRLNNLINKYHNTNFKQLSYAEQLNEYISGTGGLTREIYNGIIVLENDGSIKMKIVHVNKDKFDIYIGRPSKWGNPYTHKKSGLTLAKHIKETREEAIEAYRNYIEHGEGVYLLKDLHELKGKVLGCWCKHGISGKPEKSCHGDILIELVKKYCR